MQSVNAMHVKKSLLLSMILIATIGWPALGSANLQSGGLFEDALRKFDAGEYQAALAQVSQSLELNPGHLPGKVLLGRIRLNLGHPKAAEEAFEEARQLGAAYSLVALPLAQARNQLGKFRLNVETIQPTGHPTDIAAGLWNELGNARLALGEMLDARIAFEQSLELQPDNIGGIFGLLSVSLQEDDHEDAEKFARRAIEIAPDNADAWFFMGVLLESKSQLARAEAHFARALELEPAHQKAQLARAIVVLNLDRPEEAVGLFEAILAERPWSMETAYLLSQALAGAGQPDAAERALQKAADMVTTVTPKELESDPRLLLISSLVLYDADQLSLSSSYLERYLRIRPKDIQARKQSAKLASLTGKPLDAIRELRSIAVERPRDAQVQVMLGDVYADLKDYLSAEQHYRNAIDLTVPGLKLISRLGFAQYGQGRTDLAIDTMRRLIDLAPGRSAGASIFLGILYLHVGDLDAARQVADEIVARMPDNLLAVNLQAVVAVAEKRYEQGRSLFHSVLERAPEFDPARINLIKLDIVETDYPAAERALRELLANEPGNIAALRTFAELYIAQRDFRVAADYLEKILAIRPASVGDALLLSRVYERLGEVGDALALMKTLDKLVPNSMQLTHRMAELHLAKGDVDEARALLNDAAQLAGAHPVQRLAVAELQVKAGALDEAVQGMQRVLTEYPDAAEAQLVIARVHALKGNLIQADDVVSRLLQRHLTHVEAMSLLGDVRLARGQHSSAIQIYQRAAELDDTAALAVKLHKAMIAAGKDAEALQTLLSWHQGHEESVPVMGVLADHYARLGRRDEAIALYERVVELDERNLSAFNNLAVALMDVDSERALDAATRAYELAPENPAVLDTLGWIQVQLGDLQSGLARLREALTRNNSVPEIRYHLAVALEEFGSRAAALKELRRALASDARFAGREDAEHRLQRLEAGN